MHVGAVLRLLRVHAGVGVRELAGAIGVSGAYLSRVELGHDPPPTADRLVAIARVLGLSPAALVGLPDRLEPAVATYLSEVPAAAALLQEITERRLTAPQVARVIEFVRAEFPAADARPDGVAALLAPERVVLGLEAGALRDVLDLAATRLVRSGAAALADALDTRERLAPTAVGHGLVVPHAAGPPGPARAALVTLARPLPAAGPDGRPLRAALVMCGVGQGPAALAALLGAARLARAELVDAIARASTPEEALGAVVSFERGFVR